MADLARSAEDRLWLFDRRKYWRNWSLSAFRQAGMSVRSWGDYAFPPGQYAAGEKPALIVLACTTVGDEELELVERAAASSCRILALASWVTEPSMRALFLAGAYDVSAMPAHAQELVKLVESVLAEVSAPSRFEPLVPARAAQ